MPQTSSGGASNITSSQIVDNEIVNADINANAAIDPTKIVGEPYEVLADVSLGSPAGTLSSGTIPARTFLRLIIYVPSIASNSKIQLTFNGDGGSNYKQDVSANFAGGSATDPNSSIWLTSADVTGYRFAVVDIHNVAAFTKHLQGRTDQNNVQYLAVGRWNNNTDPITSILLAAGANMAAGTRMKVLGMN